MNEDPHIPKRPVSKVRGDRVSKISHSAPRCPKCGARMRLRRGTYGYYWVCTSYPNCHGPRGGSRSPPS